jgi:hypothetical protein
MFGRVVCVPQFGRDPQIVSRTRATGDGRFDARTGFGFVTVVAGGIEVSVADRDGLFDNAGRFGLIDFPESQSN